MVTVVSIHSRRTAVLALSALVLTVAVILLCSPAMGASPVAGSSIVNTATFTFTDANGNPIPGSSVQASTTASGAPVLSVFIEGSSDPVGMGETLTYTITYENTGNEVANNVEITFSLSDFVTYQSSSEDGSYSAGDGTVTWNIGNIDAFSGGTLTITVQVKTQADYPPGDPEAIADGSIIISSVDVVSAETSATFQESTTVGQSPNMELTLTGTPEVVSPGEIITYTLHYKNKGNLAATGVSLYDILPSQTAYVPGSASGGGVLNSRTMSWDLGTVAAGEEGDLTFQVSVSSIAESGSIIMNHASLTSRELSPVTSNIHLAYVRTASLQITKTVSPVRAGENAEYTIRIFNSGYLPAYNVIVTDSIPSGTTFVSANGGGVLSGSLISWNIDSLGIGEEKVFSVILKISASLPSGSIVTNTASLSADGIILKPTSATFQVAARTQGNVEFYDANWVRTHSFSTGNNICIQVTDSDQNRDSEAADTVSVVLKHILSGDVELIILDETGNATGVFRGCVSSNSGSAVSNNSNVSVTIDSSITVTYTDPMDSSDTSEDTALIDPFGVIFNSMTGERIPGAVVTLIDTSTGLPATIDKLPFDPNPANVTGDDGFYAFRFVKPGSYYFSISLPPGYTYPSIVPDVQLPEGFVIGTGSHREVFSLNIGDEPLNLDIPVDPPSVEILVVTKTADRDVVYIGDIVRYTITVTNAGSLPVNDTIVTDPLPHGIQYVPGTTTINDKAAADPLGSPGRTLVWSLSGVNTGAVIRVAFTAIVGVDANRGDGRNKAFAGGIAGDDKAVTSNIAYQPMRIKEGIFTTDGIIVGKVFHDKDGDDLQGKEDSGIPGAVVYMEDGTRVTADEFGKFVIFGVRPGTHVLKIDGSKLPCGFVTSVGSNRFMGSADSQFVDIVPGGMFNAEFPVVENGDSICDSSTNETPVIDYGISATSVATETVEIPYEERISDMDISVAILAPADGETVSAASTNIVVKGPSQGEFRLRVNGSLISSKRIGKRIVESEKEITILEYVSIQLAPGVENTVEIEVVDGEDITVGTAAIKITAAGAPYEIISDPVNFEITADGETVKKLKLSVADKNGTIIAATGIMTVTTTIGEIVSKDLDATADGIQVLYTGGAAEIELKSWRESGTGEITALFETLTERVTVYFPPSFREEITIGVAELLIGRGKQSGDAHYINDYRKFDRGWYSNARGAFFLRKRLWDNVLITSAYDSTKRKQYELNNERYTDYTDEDTYLLFGDESTISYEAKTQNKLFLKLERNKSQALIGDFETGFFNSKLAAYTRTLNGLKINIEKRQYQLGTFAAHTSQVKALDTIRAQGISGYYYLNNSPIVDGSEYIVVETRDRQRPWMVVESTPMTRWTDYSIDYETGAIMFRNPISSYTESFDPNYIIVSYETNNGGVSYYMYGGRGKFSPSRWMDVGVTAVTEENAASDYHQFGLDGEFRIKGIGTFNAEIATTNSLIGSGSTFRPQKGQAFSLEFKKKHFDRYEFKAYTNKTGNNFGNIHAVDFQRGFDKFGFDLLLNGAGNTVYKGRFFTEKDYLNDSFHRFSSIGFRKSKRTFEWSMELFRETARDRFINPSVYSSRYPFDNTDETPEETTSLRLGISTNPTPKIKLSLEHQQDIQYSNFNISTIGLEFRHTSTTHSYVRQEFWRYVENSGNRTIVGAESAVSNSTSLFNEYRMENTASGARTQRVIGIKNKLLAKDDVTLNLTLENLKTIRGNERNATPDSFVFGIAADYLPGKNVKVTSRYEYRDATSDTSHMAELGLLSQLSKNVSWVLKQRYFENSHSTGSSGTGSSVMVGFSYRPIARNNFNAFTRFEVQRTQSTPVQNNYSPDVRLFSLEGSYHPTRKLTLTGKYAGKAASNENIRSYTDMWASRLLLDITDSVDFGVEYRILNSHKIGTTSTGGSIELGFRAVKNLWLSAGYAFDNFDADLTGDSYYGKGLYMKLRFKLD